MPLHPIISQDVSSILPSSSLDELSCSNPSPSPSLHTLVGGVDSPTLSKSPGHAHIHPKHSRQVQARGNQVTSSSISAPMYGMIIVVEFNVPKVAQDFAERMSDERLLYFFNAYSKGVSQSFRSPHFREIVFGYLMPMLLCKFAPVEEDKDGLVPCHDESCSELGGFGDSESKDDEESCRPAQKKRRRKRRRKEDQIQEQEKDQWVEELHNAGFKNVSTEKIADFWWADAWAIIGRV